MSSERCQAHAGPPRRVIGVKVCVQAETLLLARRLQADRRQGERPRIAVTMMREVEETGRGRYGAMTDDWTGTVPRAGGRSSARGLRTTPRGAAFAIERLLEDAARVLQTPAAQRFIHPCNRVLFELRRKPSMSFIGLGDHHHA